MARVMISCPDTGKPVYTHLNYSWEAFECTRIGEHSVKCPECGKVHRWQWADADLDEDGGGD